MNIPPVRMAVSRFVFVTMMLRGPFVVVLDTAMVTIIKVSVPFNW